MGVTARFKLPWDNKKCEFFLPIWVYGLTTYLLSPYSGPDIELDPVDTMQDIIFLLQRLL